MRPITGLVRRQRAQAERRQQLLLDRGERAARPLALDQRHRQAADREDLVRSDRAVVTPGLVIDVDHIEQAGALLVPKALAEGPAATREEHLRWRYGALGTEVGTVAPKDDHLGDRLVSDCGDLLAEAIYAVEREMAVSLVDVMMRRLHLHLRSRETGEAVARRVADVMATRLCWTPEQTEREVSAYLAALAESRACVAQAS